MLKHGDLECGINIGGNWVLVFWVVLYIQTWLINIFFKKNIFKNFYCVPSQP